MFPSIPDKFYKLITLIGLIIIGFAYFSASENDKKYFIEVDKFNEMLDEGRIMDLEINEEEKKLIKFDKDISKKYNVEKSISFDKKTKDIIFTYALVADKNTMAASTLVSKRWDIYTSKVFKQKILDKKIENKKKFVEREEKYKKDYSYFTNILFILGVLTLGLGLLIWTMEEFVFLNNINDLNINKKIQDKFYNNCQSCGMKFSSSRFYGTNKDETYSNAFCEDCYQNGEYTEPELTLEQVKEKAKPFIKTNFFGRSKLNHINRLERFNRNKYFD